MLKLLLLFSLINTSTSFAETKIIVDVWGQVAEYGNLDNPPRLDQIYNSNLAQGIQLIKSIECSDCQYIYQSVLTKAYGDIEPFLNKHSLPSGRIVQHSNFGLDYIAGFIDQKLYYDYSNISLDFDSTFYNFFSGSPWRNYSELKSLINSSDKVIIFTTNHSLGYKFFDRIMKEQNVFDYLIVIKDVNGLYLYKTPLKENRFLFYSHEIELKGQIKDLKINTKVWDHYRKELKESKGLSDSLFFSLMKKQEIRSANQSLPTKSQVKQSQQKINELYRSLQNKYLNN